MVVYNTSDDLYGVAVLIVDPTLGNGNYQTLTLASAAASSGQTIVIRPATYAENFTAKPGVNYVAFNNDAQTPNVIINGTVTCSGAGTIGFSNIRFQTNGSTNSLIVSGSAATIVNCFDCDFHCTANTGISVSTSAGTLNCYSCTGDLTTTGIALFTLSSNVNVVFNYCRFTNSGLSVTPSSWSTGFVYFYYTRMESPVSTTSTGGIDFAWSHMDSQNLSVVAFVLAGMNTATNFIKHSEIFAGSNVAITINTNIVQVIICDISSTSSPVINGSGTCSFGDITWTNTGNAITTTTQTSLTYNKTATFTPSVAFGGGTTGITYTTQQGEYTQIGNIVFFKFLIQLSSKGSSTGNMTLTGLPVAFVVAPIPYIALGLWQNMTLTTNYASVSLQLTPAGTVANFVQLQRETSGGAANVADTNCSNTTGLAGSGFYFTS